MGPDGRKIYTHDTDARGGHRSATNQRSAGPYIGREVHLGVTVRQMDSKDGVKHVRPGRAVPQLVVTMDVVPAGTHRGKAVIGSLLEAHDSRLCSEVIQDPGYTLMKGKTFHHLLQQANIPLIARPASHQRTKPEQVDQPQTIGDAYLLDGQLFSKFTPKELLHLEMPPRGCSNEDKKPYIAKFEQRAAYAYRRHEKPGADGTTRWKCAFCAGQLRSAQLPHTMRRGRHLPLVELPEGTTKCCDGFLRVGADQLPMMQQPIMGTTAWWASWGRRNLVESVNSSLQGRFAAIGRGYTQTFSSARITLFLAHTIAGYNRWALKAWRRTQSYRQRLREVLKREQRKPRKDRRTRFAEMNLTAAPVAGPDPPG